MNNFVATFSGASDDPEKRTEDPMQVVFVFAGQSLD
jgi:hypothetical protein